MYPNAELDLKSVYYEDIMRNILLDEIEYALVFSPIVKNERMINWEERFEFVVLKDFPLYCVMNNRMNLAKQKSISMNTILQHDIVSWEPETDRIFSMKKIFKCYDPDKEITVVKHKKIYEKMLKEKNVVALSGSINNEFSDTGNVAYIPLSDDSIYAEFGYVKLKERKLSIQSQIVLEMLKDYLKTV